MGRRDYSTGNRVTQTHSSATVDARGNLRFQHQTRQARSPEKSQAPAESSAPTTPSHPRSFGEPDGYPVGFDMDSLEFDYGPADQPQYTLPHRKTKTQTEYLAEFKQDHLFPWIEVILEREGPQGKRECSGTGCTQPATNFWETSDKEWADLCRDGFAYNAAPPGNTKTFNGGTMVTVVHTNGVHHLPVVRCGCEGREREMVNDFLKLGLWPASFERVETVFSVDVLKDSLLSFLECHTTASQYFSRLRRCTNYAFPETVTNRYVELHRMTRQYLHMKELIEFGFAHNGKEASGRSPTILVIGGNKDVDLKSGEGHMVCSHKFDEYLADSTELPTKNECNQHKALNDRSKITQGCDVTGVGSMACMRHGCFVPGCQVNFQVGERQKNMDYCTSKGWAYGDLSEADYLLFGYDVNCLKDCIYYAVGTFHVHGHRAECYPRYATTFIRGSGVRSAEILEARWSVLNRGRPSLRYMTLPHRTEMLDALMNDNNWKAMVGSGAPVKYIYSSYTKGLDKHAVAEEEFAKLDKGLDKNQSSGRTFNRLYDVTVMDIYMAKTKKAPRRVDIEVKLADREQRSKAKEISGEKAR
ncbi:hypothetical protein FA13DRAFT_1804560 [Coprinellus micaceus]|uniref:CxC2-like cysteine cluster KDZ transposase-associated domain-containing protein n=1 Tax=Coprinellus micaceus TaxID=71717 RepID=A0A4Y7S6P1_COPMI|nr:hypothetical protein FA13DRAFT_1804560 [Coprinellus micaceus]